MTTAQTGSAPASVDVVVSILVPCYNVEKFVDRCVRSILDQDHTSLDVVLIDDGSTDNTSALCDKWAAADSRVRVIHQENHGIGGARNAGLSEAVGDFLCFVDSDDFLRRDHISQMLWAIREFKADVAVAGFERVTASPSVVEPPSQLSRSPKVEIYSQLEALRRFVGEDAMLLTVPWGTLSSRALWRDLRFPKGRLHEDEYVSHLLIEQAATVALIRESTYFYYIRSSSVTESPLTARRYFDLVNGLSAKADRFEEIGLFEESLEIRRALLRRALSRAVALAVGEHRSAQMRWKISTRECALAIIQRERRISVRSLSLLALVSPRLAHWAFISLRP